MINSLNSVFQMLVHCLLDLMLLMLTLSVPKKRYSVIVVELWLLIMLINNAVGNLIVVCETLGVWGGWFKPWLYSPNISFTVC